eukprot:GFUD01112346.1.p1 GENE.GFUD01112346.1~~GFUD01112346.1.p1  ORF type:complete len:486 (-),score=99.75 GFUD01112346.1:15-1472(-)
MLLVDMMTILKVGIGMHNRLDRTKKELREENCRFSVNSMPREMLRMIFQKLEFKDLKNVMLVCRYWRSLGGDPILWRNFKMLCIRNPAYFVQILSIPRLSRIENITLDGLYKSWAKYNDSQFDFLRDTCVKVLEINGIADVSDVSPDILAKVINQCEKAGLGCTLSKVQYREIFAKMSEETNLKKVCLSEDVRDVPADVLGKALTNVEDLTLADLTTSQILSVFTMMSKTSKTLHLNLDTANLTTLPTSLLCSAVSNLKSLTISEATLDQAKISGLMLSLSQGTNLSYLHLGESDLRSVPAGLLARGLVRVETVEMMSTLVDTRQIIELCKERVDNHSVIKNLHLRHDLTDVPADILARAINKLETADILTCDVTEEQTLKIFTEMSQKTNMKSMNYNTLCELRLGVTMPGLKKVSCDTLAKAFNKLNDVLLFVGEEDDKISQDQLQAILDQSAVETNLKRVEIVTWSVNFAGQLILSENVIIIK